MVDAAAQAHLAEVDRRVAAGERHLSELMGVVNAAHGALVGAVAEILDDNLWCGPGYASSAQYVALKTGLSIGRARDVVLLAERRHELPAVAEALAGGEITLDQVSVIVRHVPEGYDRAVTEFARYATVDQLRRALPRYGWEPRPKPAAPDGPERSVAMTTDDHGRWHGRFCLPADEGAVVERAIRSHRDDLYRRLNDDLPHGADKVQVTNADGLLSVAETALQAGEARFPGADRYLVHAHLEAGSTQGSAVGRASLHGGPTLPAALRRHLLCDASLVPYLEVNGTPINLGRKTRAISRALRRSIEHRDGGCAVPGCGTRVGTEIHHIEHWEDGGPTTTANLLCLCRRHHRLHHEGLIAIEGNADLPDRTPGAVTYHDRFQRPITTGRPTCPRPGHTPAAAAEAVGLTPRPYPQRHGERLDRSQLYLAPNPGHPDHPAEQLARRRAEAEAAAQARADGTGPVLPVDRPVRQLHLLPADPTRAGP